MRLRVQDQDPGIFAEGKYRGTDNIQEDSIFMTEVIPSKALPPSDVIFGDIFLGVTWGRQTFGSQQPLSMVMALLQGEGVHTRLQHGGSTGNVNPKHAPVMSPWS